MNNYINNIINRHTETGTNVKPRLRGMFEPDVTASGISPHQDYPGDESARKTHAEQSVDDLNRFQMNPAMSRNLTEKKPESGMKKDQEKGKEGILGSYPSFDTSLFSNEDKKGKKYKPSEPGINIEVGFSAEEPLNNNNNPDTGPGNGAGSKKYKMEYDPDKAQEVFSRHLLKDTHVKVKPAFITMPAPESTGFQKEDSGLHGLLGERPLIKNSNNEYNRPLSGKPLQAETPPVIKVTIGRIDVRAVAQPISSSVKSKAAPTPKMSLEDYLNQRKKTEK